MPPTTEDPYGTFKGLFKGLVSATPRCKFVERGSFLPFECSSVLWLEGYIHSEIICCSEAQMRLTTFWKPQQVCIHHTRN